MILREVGWQSKVFNWVPWWIVLQMLVLVVCSVGTVSSLIITCIHFYREQRNHGLKNESDCVRIGISIKKIMNRGRFCERSYRWVFVIHTAIKWKHSFCFRTSFIPIVSHMKIANVHIGTIHQNVRIALQFSYQFAIFVSVCNFHISLQFSHFGV